MQSNPYKKTNEKQNKETELRDIKTTVKALTKNDLSSAESIKNEIIHLQNHLIKIKEKPIN